MPRLTLLYSVVVQRPGNYKADPTGRPVEVTPGDPVTRQYFFHSEAERQNFIAWLPEPWKVQSDKPVMRMHTFGEALMELRNA